jgi:hypothetical protein
MPQEFDYLEFFAGVGNLTSQARACGYKVARFDILDNKRPQTRKSTLWIWLHGQGLRFSDYFRLNYGAQ